MARAELTEARRRFELEDECERSVHAAAARGEPVEPPARTSDAERAEVVRSLELAVSATGGALRSTMAEVLGEVALRADDWRRELGPLAGSRTSTSARRPCTCATRR